MRYRTAAVLSALLIGGMFVVPSAIISAHRVVDVFAAVVSSSYAVWAVWYMHRSQVKDAFGRA